MPHPQRERPFSASHFTDRERQSDFVATARRYGNLYSNPRKLPKKILFTYARAPDAKVAKRE
jgi:hypothetical protein